MACALRTWARKGREKNSVHKLPYGTRTRPIRVTSSPTCPFTAIYHRNFPRPAPIWPCSSFGRATVICSGDRRFEPHRVSSENFSPSPYGPIFFLVLTLRRYYFGYLFIVEHFNLPHLNHYMYNKRYVFFTIPSLVHTSCTPSC